MSNFYHENKIQFAEAIRETAKNSGFSESLIEINLLSYLEPYFIA